MCSLMDEVCRHRPLFLEDGVCDFSEVFFFINFFCHLRVVLRNAEAVLMF